MHWHARFGQDDEEAKRASVDRGVLRRVWGFARPYRWLIAGFLISMIVSSFFAVATPLIVRDLIDNAIPESNRGRVNLLALGLIAVAIGDALLSLASRWWSSQVGEGLIYDLRVALFDHVQRMPLAFFTNTQTGTLISRLNNDVVGAQRAVTGTLGSVVSDLITVTITIAAMLFLEWRLTLLALLILPVFVIPSKRVGRKLQTITRESMELNAQMNTTMTERFGVSGAQLVKLFGRHDSEYEGFSSRAGRVRDIGVRSALLGRLFFMGLGVAAAVGVAGIYWVGSQFVIDGDLEIGDLVAMGILVGRVYSPLASLTNARVDLMTAFVSFDRVFEVLDAPNPIVDRTAAVDLVNPVGRVEFRNVQFEYPAAATTTIASLTDKATSHRASGMVLHNISAVVEPGQLVALVGPSGSGKTTMSNLVPRVYDVTDGEVLVDGLDVRNYTQASLRDAIGVVTQDPHLFHETVAANLRYAQPDATDAELESAARAAQIHDLIISLPEGYETIVGERGYRLSGGEKQRLAIARMLLKNPSIVILDEATSHLDSENESLVQAALESALTGRTSMVIAHRLSTIIAADQILVLDQGVVVERGTHDELMQTGGLYSELYQTLASGPAVDHLVDLDLETDSDSEGDVAPAAVGAHHHPHH